MVNSDITAYLIMGMVLMEMGENGVKIVQMVLRNKNFIEDEEVPLKI